MSELNRIGLSYKTDKASDGHDYLRHYEAALQHLRQERFTLIEIGGLNGASLNMWRDYFPHANIVCVDIDERVASFSGHRIAVEIGSAGSPPFLLDVAANHGPARVILDDGSHRWDHQRIAFQTLFPTLAPGGYYIIEDIHTSFEPGFSGYDDLPFIEYLKTITDYLHLRGEFRRAFERKYNKTFVSIAKQIEWALFVPRSCIIKKK